MRNAQNGGTEVPPFLPAVLLLFDFLPEEDAEKHEVNEHHYRKQGAEDPRSAVHHPPAVIAVSHHMLSVYRAADILAIGLVRAHSALAPNVSPRDEVACYVQVPFTRHRVSSKEIASTRMYCEGSQESDFQKLLQNTGSYHFTSKGELIFD